jgi:prophage regulatory protein
VHDLMGVYEIAVRLGVSRSRASQIVLEKGFPDPAARLAMGVIWEAADVEAWIATHRPQLAEEPES